VFTSFDPRYQKGLAVRSLRMTLAGKVTIPLEMLLAHSQSKRIDTFVEFACSCRTCPVGLGPLAVDHYNEVRPFAVHPEIAQPRNGFPCK